MLDGPRWTRSNSCTPPAVKKLEHARRENKAKEVQERTAAERAEMQKRVDEAVAEIKDLEARRRELEKEQHELLVKRKEYVESLRKYRSEQFAQVHQGEDARAVIAARIDQRMQLARDGLLEHRHIYELVYNIAADDERRETRRKANKWDEPKGLSSFVTFGSMEEFKLFVLDVHDAFMARGRNAKGWYMYNKVSFEDSVLVRNTALLLPS
eukprot:TRINITY_DN768_c0_g2_i15.p2 TRINITY_DN768_c0_g2~~TRINITY_DN768_c0_g2_i15.p2  ORF type:complete len:211 (-),score=41.17 TRINITY_DN768_c0_g2_i15:1076-1708(-)